jgi:hypothetical protein
MFAVDIVAGSRPEVFYEKVWRESPRRWMGAFEHQLMALHSRGIEKPVMSDLNNDIVKAARRQSNWKEGLCAERGEDAAEDLRVSVLCSCEGLESRPHWVMTLCS